MRVWSWKNICKNLGSGCKKCFTFSCLWFICSFPFTFILSNPINYDLDWRQFLVCQYLWKISSLKLGGDDPFGPQCWRLPKYCTIDFLTSLLQKHQCPTNHSIRFRISREISCWKHSLFCPITFWFRLQSVSCKVIRMEPMWKLSWFTLEWYWCYCIRHWV